MSFENLQDKYRYVGNQELNSWKDSEPVVALSQFIKSNSILGAHLVSDKLNGQLSIQFNPGLTSQEPDRWKLGAEATDLFFKAKDDLAWLMHRSMIKLKQCGYIGPPLSEKEQGGRVGPSGVQKPVRV
jgi:hypothetical protein